MVWIRDNEEARVTQAPERLYVINQDELISVAITSDEASVRFDRVPEGWQFREPNGIGVNGDRWGGIVLLLSGPQIERELGWVEDPREFGLDLPSTVELTIANGSQVIIEIGDRTPDKRHHYAMLRGTSTVLLVNADWGAVLQSLLEEPPFPYWYYRVNPERARVFEIDQANQRATMFLGTNPGQLASGRVLIDDADTRDMTAEEYRKALSLVGGPPTLQVLKLPDTTNPALGFASPTATLRLTYQLAKPIEERFDFSIVYLVGGLTADGQHYFVTTSDTPALLTFNAAWIDALLGFSDSLR
jgi:hypothetical protein